MGLGRGLWVTGGGGVLLASIVSTPMFWTVFSVLIIAASLAFLVVLIDRYVIQRSRPRRLSELGNALNGRIELDTSAALAGAPRVWAVYAVGSEFHHGVYPAKGDELRRLMPERHSQIVQVAVFPDGSRARSAAARMLRAGFSPDELRSLLPDEFTPGEGLPEAGTDEQSQPIGLDVTQPIVKATSMNNQRDTTQYQFDGEIRGKARTVLAVVTRHVREHPQITFGELRAAFPDSLQASSQTHFSAVRAVVARLELLSEPEHKRFFMKPEEMLTLPDGVVVVVREWNLFNIRTFLARAEELGYQIAIVDTP
jgi:hypothetical protein